MDVHGDTTHDNDDHHLHGGIEEDELWHWQYHCVVTNSNNLYHPPQGMVGKAVVTAYVKELRGIHEW